MNRVLVLGGGFGGIATAVALRSQLDRGDEIVLVERRRSFVMGLRKNWAVVGSDSIAAGERELARLTERGIDVVAGTIEAIRPDVREVDVDGRTLQAEAIVVALGAERNPDAVPGFGEHAIDIYDEGAVERASAAVDAFDGGRLVIGIFGAPYPCPPAPYELGLLLADRFESQRTSGGIFVFTPQPKSLPILGEAGCAAFDGRLASAGVSFRPNTKATVIEPGVVVASDARIPFDLLLGIPPHRVPPVVAAAGLTDGTPWVKVDPRTLETRFDGVYAIGDVTAIQLANGLPLPKAGVFAQGQGEIVAARIAERFAGRNPEATFGGRGMCFLETGRGTATMVHGDFYADPPAVDLAEPNPDHLAAKHAFEADRLAAWFGR